MKIGWSSFFCPFFICSFLHTPLILSEKTKLVSVQSPFFLKQETVLLTCFSFFLFQRNIPWCFLLLPFFLSFGKDFFFIEGLVFTHFETSFFYLHFCLTQKIFSTFSLLECLLYLFNSSLWSSSLHLFFFFCFSVFSCFFHLFFVTPKNSLSFIISLFSISFTFFTVFCILVNFCKTLYFYFLSFPDKLGVVRFFVGNRLHLFFHVLSFFCALKNGFWLFFTLLFWFSFSFFFFLFKIRFSFLLSCFDVSKKKDGFLFQHTWGDIFFFSLCVFFFSSVFFKNKNNVFVCEIILFFSWRISFRKSFSLFTFSHMKIRPTNFTFSIFFCFTFFFLHFSTFSFITFLFDHFFFHLFVHLFLLFSLFSVLFPLTVLSLLLYLRVTLSFFFSISCFFFFFFSIAVFCVFLRVLTHFFFFLDLILLFFLLVYFFLRFPIFCHTKWKMFVFFFFFEFCFFCEPSLYLRLISSFSSLRRPLSLFVPCFLIFRVSWCYIPWLSVINLLFGLFKNCRLFLEKSCNKVLWFFFSILFSKIPWCSSFCCQFFLYICFFHATVSWRSLAS